MNATVNGYVTNARNAARRADRAATDYAACRASGAVAYECKYMTVYGPAVTEVLDAVANAALAADDAADMLRRAVGAAIDTDDTESFVRRCNRRDATLAARAALRAASAASRTAIIAAARGERAASRRAADAARSARFYARAALRAARAA